jgi:hypothetical protein|tara:strand:- start:8637 stop:8840 length:204 start_codon:yes stop_codon:yes gene_type:complete
MIDPMITDLTNKLQTQIRELNETWLQLQANDCYARLEILNGYATNQSQELKLKSVEQNIQYIDSTEE